VKTILLADDSITIQKVVELTFSDGEYRVLCVGNGAQALRKIAESRPDIVLLDVIMPEKNGYEVCEAMRSDPATAGLPVLLLTGTFEPFDQRRADAAGADGHLTKPFESHTLVARVEELIAARRSGSLPAHAPAPVPAEVAAPAPAFAAPAAALEETMPGPARSFAPMPPPVVPELPVEVPHPAFTSPDASSGGSYMGFADLAVGNDDDTVPDRFDSAGGATLRLDRPPIPVAPAPAEASGSDTGIEGFMPGYEMAEMPRSVPAPAPAAPLRVVEPEPMRAAETASVPAADPTPAALASSLSDETLDRLADLIVRRMSDRVVREIAWDVLPEVAEAVVRERIRALEDAGR
jgi:CheY-like chemotaxis protein